SGNGKFWSKHCFAVPLLKVEEADAQTKDEKPNARKVATCLRCNKVMYPGGKGGSPENHKKGHCSDGFKQKAPAEDSAPWPQPAGLFTTGSEFHPLPFLAAVRDLYEKVVIAADPGNLGLEDEAFSIMLQQPGRIITVN
ncbi:hypothetical protein B0H14DRAFT_2218996, partial [Mycena olivaceomarginata]